MEEERNQQTSAGVTPPQNTPTEMSPVMTKGTSPKTVGLVGGVFAVVVIVLVGVWAYFSGNLGFLDSPAEKNINYTIQGVQPVTIYNHIGENSYLVTSTAAALKMVLEFYGEDFDSGEVADLNERLFTPENPGAARRLNSIGTVAVSMGYDIDYVFLPTVDDLARYINDEQKIPLIFPHSPMLDHSREFTFISYGVLLGVLEDEQEFVVHDYFLGHNKRVSFSEFEQLWEGIQPQFRHEYLVIYPKDVSYRGEEHEPYAERTLSMEKAAPLIDKITVARGASLAGMYPLQVRLAKEVIEHPNFEEYVPPYYKIVAYAHAADGPLFLESPPDLAYAEELTTKAEALNQNLDAPFGDFWPGFVDQTNLVHDKSNAPPYLRGVIHRYRGNYDAAITSFNESLAIWPYSRAANYQLQIAENLKVQ